MGARFTLGRGVVGGSQPCGTAGWLALLLRKTGDVETNPGPTSSHRHNTTPPLQTLVQSPYPLPTPHLHHPHHRNPDTHTSSIPPVRTGLVKLKPNPLIHSPTSPPTPPQTKHIHISHTSPTPRTPRTTLIHSTSAALAQYLNYVYHTHTLHSPQPHLIIPTPTLPSSSYLHTLSAYTHETQSTVHASQSQ